MYKRQTVNLGFGLSRQGKNVLRLDADPQGDLTKCLGIKNPRELTSTISSVMDYLIAHSDEDAYPDFEYTAPIRQHTEGVDFIPANASLAATEVTLCLLYTSFLLTSGTGHDIIAAIEN